MPILGVIASSISGNLYTSAYDSIATLSGGSTSVTFSSIPSTYAHLQIRAIVRMASGTSGSDNMGIQFNADTSANYSSHVLQGDGASVSAQSFTTSSQIILRDAAPRDAVTANIYGALIIDIFDYTSTNKNKTVRVLLGKDYNGTSPVGSVAFNSGLWINSSTAINSIKLFDLDNPSYNFTAASTFALYGIKAA